MYKKAWCTCKLKCCFANLNLLLFYRFRSFLSNSLPLPLLLPSPLSLLMLPISIGSDILFYLFLLGQPSCWTVQLGSVQCHVPHALYRLRALPASSSYRTLAYPVQYDNRRDLLCCVHWYYVQFDHVYWFIGEALQWKGNETPVETHEQKLKQYSSHRNNRRLLPQSKQNLSKFEICFFFVVYWGLPKKICDKWKNSSPVF